MTEKIVIPSQLYDLSKDPGEINNAWEPHPKVVKDLTKRLNVYIETKHNA